MDIIINKDFIKIFQLIEWINKECSSKLGLDTRTDLSISECRSLSIYLTVKYKGKFHSFEFSIHQMEMRAARYNISDQLSNFISIAARELRKKIEEDVNPKESKELKDLKHTAEIIADLSDDLPRADVMTKKLKNSIKNKTWAAEPEELWGKKILERIAELRKLLVDHPKYRKKLFHGDFDGF